MRRNLDSSVAPRGEQGEVKQRALVQVQLGGHYGRDLGETPTAADILPSRLRAPFLSWHTKGPLEMKYPRMDSQC